jgi:hypothetical protein
MKVESSTISKLLKKVFLGGIVEEAVVDLDLNTVQAVDPTNALFLKVTEIPSEDKGIGRVGIGSPTLSTVIKHLESIKGEVEIGKENKRLLIGAKGRGEVKYLTVEEEFISSLVEEDNIAQLVEPCEVSVEISQQFCSDFNFYMSLVKTKAATFNFDAKTQNVVVTSGLESEHQFSIPIGKAEMLSKVEENFSVTIYGEHANQIFNVLEWNEDEKPLVLIAPEHPLIIYQNDDNIWACLPLSEIE